MINFVPKLIQTINFNFRQQQSSTKIKGLILKHKVDVWDFDFDICECFVQKLSSQDRVFLFAQVSINNIGVVLKSGQTLLFALLVFLYNLLFCPFGNFQHLQTQEYVTNLYLKPVWKAQ